MISTTASRALLFTTATSTRSARIRSSCLFGDDGAWRTASEKGRTKVLRDELGKGEEEEEEKAEKGGRG